MQYVELEIPGVVTLPMLPATSVKKAPGQTHYINASKIGAKLDLNLKSVTFKKLGRCLRDTRRN